MRALLFFGSMLFWSCNTTDELPEDYLGLVTYQITSTTPEMDITYTDEDGSSKTVQVNDGDWVYEFGAPIGMELSVNVKTEGEFANVNITVLYVSKLLDRNICKEDNGPLECSITAVTKKK